MVEKVRVFNPWASDGAFGLGTSEAPGAWHTELNAERSKASLVEMAKKPVARSWLDELSVETAGANYKRLSKGLRENFKEVRDTAAQFPLTTAALGVVGGVCLYGAVRLGVANRLGIPLKNETDRVLVHLTRAQKVEPILSSGKIGGKWGIFALEGNQLPEHNLARNVKTLVPGELSGVVPFSGEVVSRFHKPIPVGPFSLYRNLAGVRSSWLGAVELNEGKFVANEIFKDGVFRPATAKEISRFKRHQFVLDYGIDAEIWSVGAVSAFRYELDKPRKDEIKSPIPIRN